MPRELQPCGTQGAYKRHLKAGEPACLACRLANAAHVAKYTVRKPPRVYVCTAERHGGTTTAFDEWGCRCEEARAAKREANRRSVLRRRGVLPPLLVPSLGSARRFRALQALGWSDRMICQELGYKRKGALKHLFVGRTCERETAEKIAALFERWSMTPGPCGKTRTWALKQGWLPPLAWSDIDDPDENPAEMAVVVELVDRVVVDRAVAGLRPVMNRLERVEAVRQLAALGLSDRMIAVRLGAGKNSVCMLRLRHGIPAGLGMEQAS